MVHKIRAFFLLLLLASVQSYASWEPFHFVNATTTTGTIAATALFTSKSSAGYYVVSVYVETTTAVALSTAIVSISYTSNGVARSIVVPTLAMSTAANAVSNYINIHADSGTAVTYSLTSVGSGSYWLRIGWKVQGS